jgi:hypothetical protein
MGARVLTYVTELSSDEFRNVENLVESPLGALFGNFAETLPEKNPPTLEMLAAHPGVKNSLPR